MEELFLSKKSAVLKIHEWGRSERDFRGLVLRQLSELEKRHVKFGHCIFKIRQFLKS